MSEDFNHESKFWALSKGEIVQESVRMKLWNVSCVVGKRMQSELSPQVQGGVLTEPNNISGITSGGESPFTKHIQLVKLVLQYFKL